MAKLPVLPLSRSDLVAKIQQETVCSFMMKRMTRRQFAWSVFAVTTAATVPLAFASCRADASPLPFVDAELRDEAQRILAMTGPGMELTRESLKHVRAALAPPAPALMPDTIVSRQLVPVGGDDPDVAIYVVNARAGTSRPAIVHMHGGGFVAGSARSTIPSLQAMARRLDCVVIGVEYRLAPETTYLGSTADNFAALLWLHDHVNELGVDPDRVVVMGESAGGGHAALLARAARDNGLRVALQVLVYPMLDDRTGTTREPKYPIGTIGWTGQANRFAWRSFLGKEPGGSDVSSAAVPARLADMKDLAPAFIGVGSIDLFVEENVAYANRLAAAGVATELLVAPGAFHGFDALVPEADVSRRFEKARWDALRAALGVAL